MKQSSSVHWKSTKIAVLYALAFVLLALVYQLCQSEKIASGWKIAAIAGSGIIIVYVFSRKELIIFGGYCMLMTGLNYIWHDNDVDQPWKIAATLVVLAQLFTPDNKASAKEHEPKIIKP